MGVMNGCVVLCPRPLASKSWWQSVPLAAGISHFARLPQAGWSGPQCNSARR